MGSYPIAIVGESFSNDDGSSRQNEIARCRVGEPVDLVRDPNNKNDELCVRVLSARGVQIGTIGRVDAWIAERLDDGRPVSASIRSIGNGARGLLGVVLTVDTSDLGAEDFERQRERRDDAGSVTIADASARRDLPKKKGLFSSRTDPMKTCRQCLKDVPLLMSKCRECGYQFTEAEMDASRAEEKRRRDAGSVGCLIAAAVLVLIPVTYCSKPPSPEEQKAAEEKQKESIAQAEADRAAGLHCLSGWDGSNRSFVELVKAQLREPDSFEHIQTKILPEEKGRHLVQMQYRARNGFGGMNVETAYGSVDHNSCEAQLIAAGS